MVGGYGVVADAQYASGQPGGVLGGGDHHFDAALTRGRGPAHHAFGIAVRRAYLQLRIQAELLQLARARFHQRKVGLAAQDDAYVGQDSNSLQSYVRAEVGSGKSYLPRSRQGLLTSGGGGDAEADDGEHPSPRRDKPAPRLVARSGVKDDVAWRH